MSETRTCNYCGAMMAADEQQIECPDCGREGCEKCMPAGTNVPCPDCENADDD